MMMLGPDPLDPKRRPVLGEAVQPQKELGREATRLSIRQRPPSPDSTQNRLILATAALDRLRLIGQLEGIPIVEREATQALADLQEDTQDA